MGNVNIKNPFEKKSQPIPIQQPVPPPIMRPIPPPIQYIQPIPPVPMTKVSSTKMTTSEKPITISQPNLANINLYNNPMQQYSIIVNNNALKNCMVSASNNISALNQCVLSYIKGTHKVNDSTTEVVNLVSNNPNMSKELTTTLSQNDINNLTGANLTAFNINTNGQFNNIKVDLVALQQSIFYGDVNNALTNNVYGYDTTTNQFKNISLLASNYTVDSSGNLTIVPNFQNFDNIENTSTFMETKTIILIFCIILYLIIMSK